MKNIGLLTSGGDAPGMNAAIRAVVLSAQKSSVNCFGFERGYNGLIDDQYQLLTPHGVKHISHLGGTILKSARCDRMFDTKYQQQALDNLKRHDIDALVVIGGDGSFRGASELVAQTDIKVVGIPGTIDNDIDGSDNTIGFRTAVHTAVEAIDKIRDTADAFERIFIVEVMGRHSGFIATNVGISAEAEQIISPELNLDGPQLIQNITTHITNYLSFYGNSSYIIVMAENTFEGGSEQLAKMLTEQIGIECRAVVLGHVQRGGMAVPEDRLLATKLGAYAIEVLQQGQDNVMVGVVKGELSTTPLNETGNKQKAPDSYLLNLYQNTLLT